MSHSDTMIAATHKVVRWSGATALFSTLGLASQVFTRGLTLSALFPAFIIATTGFQLINSHRLLAVIAPHEARRWMRPLGFALYAAAALIGLATLATVAAHVAAP
jgi:hypothetical protein